MIRKDSCMFVIVVIIDWLYIKLAIAEQQFLSKENNFLIIHKSSVQDLKQLWFRLIEEARSNKNSQLL